MPVNVMLSLCLGTKFFGVCLMSIFYILFRSVFLYTLYIVKHQQPKKHMTDGNTSAKFHVRNFGAKKRII